MNDNVTNIVLEQLREMRRENAERHAEFRGLHQEMQSFREEMNEKLASLEGGVQGLTGLIVALGHASDAFDTRLERVEEKVGIDP